MPQHRAITLTRAALSVSPGPFVLTDRLKYHEDDAVLHVVGALTRESDYLGASSRVGEWWKRPIDIGWDWGVIGCQRGYFGYETADGSKVWTAEPWFYAAISLHQLKADRCSVVTDAFDGLRHDVRRVAAGIRSEGWVSADLGEDALTIALRDVWQRFPKELRVSRDQRGLPR